MGVSIRSDQKEEDDYIFLGYIVYSTSWDCKYSLNKA